jgi:hypothetical protein
MKNLKIYFGIMLCSLLLFGCVCLPFSPEEAMSIGEAASPTKKAYSETQSKNYWSATAPFTISDWTYSGKSLRLVLQNMDMQKITLTKIASSGFTLYSGNQTFSAGQSVVIDVTTGLPCGSAGDYFQFEDVSITYSKSSISGLQQVGNIPIVGKCS